MSYCSYCKQELLIGGLPHICPEQREREKSNGDTENMITTPQKGVVEVDSHDLLAVLKILNSFDYEPDDDSSMGMSFFSARLCEDTFFHIKGRLEEDLKSPANVKMIAMGCKPDPYKFEIVELEHCGSNTIILAEYEGCQTFDGLKLMVLRGIHNLMDFDTLDPHFLDEDYAVIARFIPNELGWKMARKVCE